MGRRLWTGLLMTLVVLPACHTNAQLRRDGALAASRAPEGLGIPLGAKPHTAAPLPPVAEGTNAAARVQARLAAAIKPTEPGCSMGVAREGHTIFQSAYGLANLETNTPNTPRTRFHASSMAKQFTALAVMLLVSDGKVRLADDVRTYVPEVPDLGEKITIANLLTHTSGLRDSEEYVAIARGFRIYDAQIKWDDLLYYLSRQRDLNFSPGTEYSYNNTGYAAAALVVERISGKKLPDFLAERVFTPLGMRDTLVHADNAIIIKGGAAGYDPNDDGGWRESTPTHDISGPSNLVTTVADMLRWHEEVRRPRLFAQEIAAMRTPAVLLNGETVPEGLGLHLAPFHGMSFVYHGGGDPGHESFSGLLPHTGLALVLLCNRLGVDADLLGRAALEAFSGVRAPESAPTEYKLSGEEISARVGVFASRQTGEVVHIRSELDGLAWGESQGPKLVSQGGDKFRVGSSRQLVFQSRGAARVDALHLKVGPSRPWTRLERLTTPAAHGPVMAEFNGRYRSEEAEALYRVSVQDGALVFRNDPWGEFKIRPLSGDLFKGYFLAEFTRDARGRVDGVFLSAERSRRIFLKRVEEGAGLEASSPRSSARRAAPPAPSPRAPVPASCEEPGHAASSQTGAVSHTRARLGFERPSSFPFRDKGSHPSC